jgi:arabinogalactan oligomer/maltooligosaccharide transport system permease protein
MNLQIEEKSSFIKTKNSVENKSKFLKKALKNGDKFTRLSFFIMGISNLIHGQIVKGLFFLFAEISFLIYMIGTGLKAVLELRTLGEVTQGWVFNEELGIDLLQDGDNSMLILLFGVFALFIIIAFILIWTTNIRSAMELQSLKESGKKIPTFKDDIKDYLDGKLYNTLMFLPLLGIFAFTILPLVFMILVAFTNYDSTHQPPGSLFTWVGLENFRIMLGIGSTISNTFWPVLGWTLVWAVTATFSTYIGGILLALLINKKNVKIKGFWRTMFMLSIAIPQFVTLLTMQTMLQDEGAMNVLLQDLGLISAPIHFLTEATLARITIIVINLWIGIPFTMITVTGILMNIPKELYEAAKVDGANSVVIFFKITMPYILFITAPTLITGFIGNINNFNVIYLLTKGGPANLDYYQAGKTDLLVTWLYKLTVTGKEYSYASTIGIIVFILSVIFSLFMYRRTSAYKEEGDFS